MLAVDKSEVDYTADIIDVMQDRFIVHGTRLSVEVTSVYQEYPRHNNYACVYYLVRPQARAKVQRA